MITRFPFRAMRTTVGGFTLVELMVTLGVMAILVLVAAPSVRDALMNVRMSAQANDLMADLALARSHAVKTGVPVFLCPSLGPAHTSCSGTNWEVGWLVFADLNGNGVQNVATEPALKSRQAVAPGNTIATANIPTAGGTSYFPYRPTGVTNTSAATSPTFNMCDGRTTPNAGRKITISPTGRAVAARCTCPACP